MISTSDNPVRRQLAAIMFTDIAGYTAMMQIDEDQGMRLLARYRSALQEMLARHSGELLQHIGDGSLTMFQSAVQAVHCAIDLQKILQQDPVIPVRAGIHLGDVVIEANSVYGDGVNVASRIEQLADPGSILISQALFESIRNQRKIRVKYLGAPKLRNVMEPTRVYAVRARGIVVPNRLTRHLSIDVRSLRHTGVVAAAICVFAILGFLLSRMFVKKNEVSSSSDQPLPELVVSPFQNHTDDASYDALGKLAANQIARALNSAKLVKVCNAEDVTTSDFYQLRGGYFKEEEVIIFQTMITRGPDRVILTVFDPQAGSLTKPEEAVVDLTDQILGFWATKDEANLHAQIKPPKFDAFKEYLQGQQELYRSPQLAVQSFTDAIAIDGDFIAPRMGIIHAHFLTGDFVSAQRDILRLKEATSVSEDDRQVLTHWELLIDGEAQRAFDTLNRLLIEDPQNIFARLQLGRIALEHLRQPRKALEMIRPIIEPENAETTRSWASLLLYQEILLKLNRHEQLVDVTSAAFSSESDPAILTNYVRALCRLERMQEVNQLIEACRTESLPFHCREEILIPVAAVESYLIGDTSRVSMFVSLGLGMTPESRQTEATLHYLGKHYNTAAAFHRELAENSIDTILYIDYITKAAIAQLNAGDSAIAASWLYNLARRDFPVRRGMKAYHQARLAVALGDHAHALDYLEEATALGCPHSYGYFNTDLFLYPLFRENRFQRLTEAKD